jgi:hypothetical protein
VDGLQTRECENTGGCPDTKNPPALSQECEYVAPPSSDGDNGHGHECVEDWVCTEWDECTRECVDQNECGTTVNKPLVESKECVTDEPIPEDTEEEDQEEGLAGITGWSIGDYGKESLIGLLALLGVTGGGYYYYKKFYIPAHQKPKAH